MSRLPSEAASRNMSACSAQAMSQVGCRLMVASSANTSLPLAPGRCGDIARAFATKAAMSSDADGLVSGSRPALRASAEATSPADFGLMGSPAMSARGVSSKLYVGRRPAAVNASDDNATAQRPVGRLVRDGLVLRRRIAGQRDGQRHWSRAAGQNVGHLGRHGLQLAALVGLVEELVEHRLDRGFGCIRPGVPHVVMLEAGVQNSDPGLLALPVV